MKKGVKVFGILVLLAAGGSTAWYFYNDRTFVVPEFIQNVELPEFVKNIEVPQFIKDIPAFFQNIELPEFITDSEVYKFFFPEEENTQTVYVTAVETLMGVSSGIQNRYAGVVEAQETVEVAIDSGRKVTEVQVKTGEEVKEGQLLFEYDLSSIQTDLQEAELDLDRLKNEAVSITDQISTLEKEKAKAKADAQLSYTVEIETQRMNLKKNEYDQKSKSATIENLKKATENTEVRSSINGIIQKIDSTKLSSPGDGSVTDTLSDDSYSSYYGNDGNSNAFITILSTGAYRIKGMTNELNLNTVENSMGSPVIVRSRVDENQTWSGIMGMVDRENASNNSSSSSYYGMDSGDMTTSSSSYPFYVILDSSEGLMLGQHIYIEMDEGQENVKEGVWLYDFYIADLDTDAPYVWVSNKNRRLEKRYITLGEHDDFLMEYQILSGLENEDYIAYPAAGLTEGMRTLNGTREQTMEAMTYSDDTGYEDALSDFSDEYFGGADALVDDFDEEGIVIDESDGIVYDENGEVIFEDEGEIVYEDDGYIVDEDGNIIFDDDLLFEEEVEEGETIYYDEDGNEISEEEFFADWDFEEEEGETLYYDEDGNEITEEEFFALYFGDEEEGEIIEEYEEEG